MTASRATIRSLVLHVAIAGAILFPLTRRVGWDSFPISSFPMFSRGDIGSRVVVSHVVLRTDHGAVPASPSLVGTPEPMVAKALVEGAIASGTAAELCARIASRAANEGARTVEVVTSTFDAKAYFASPPRREPIERHVHAACTVTGR